MWPFASRQSDKPKPPPNRYEGACSLCGLTFYSPQVDAVKVLHATGHCPACDVLWRALTPEHQASTQMMVRLLYWQRIGIAAARMSY